MNERNAKAIETLRRFRQGDADEQTSTLAALRDAGTPEPAFDRDDLTPTGQTILDAIEAAHLDDLLYSGSSLDPSCWSNSTFPEAARRITAALDRNPGGSMNPETVEPRDAEIERIAQSIRIADGNHDLGAAVLAERLYDAGLRLERDRAAVPGLRERIGDLDREPTLAEVAEYGLDGSPGTAFNTLQWKLDRVRAALAASEDRAAVPDDDEMKRLLAAARDEGIAWARTRAAVPEATCPACGTRFDPADFTHHRAAQAPTGWPKGAESWIEVAQQALDRNGADWDHSREMAEAVAVKLWNYLSEGLIESPAAVQAPTAGEHVHDGEWCAACVAHGGRAVYDFIAEMAGGLTLVVPPDGERLGRILTFGKGSPIDTVTGEPAQVAVSGMKPRDRLGDLAGRLGIPVYVTEAPPALARRIREEKR